MPPRDERRARAQHAFGWFWIDLLNLNKLLVRERPVSAAEYLAELRSHCLVLLQATEAADVDLDVKSLRDRLVATTRCADVSDMRAAVEELVVIHERVGRALAPAFDLVYPDDLPALVAEKLNAVPRSPGTSS